MSGIAVHLSDARVFGPQINLRVAILKVAITVSREIWKKASPSMPQ